MGEIKPISVTSAQPLDSDTKARIEKTFTAKHKGEAVSFCYSVNPALLGGVLINDNEIYYDATLKTQLDKVKHIL